MVWCVFFQAHLVKNGKKALFNLLITYNKMFLNPHFKKIAILTFPQDNKKILAKYLVQSFSALQTKPIGTEKGLS